MNLQCKKEEKNLFCKKRKTFPFSAQNNNDTLETISISEFDILIRSTASILKKSVIILSARGNRNRKNLFLQRLFEKKIKLSRRISTTPKSATFFFLSVDPYTKIASILIVMIWVQFKVATKCWRIFWTKKKIHESRTNNKHHEIWTWTFFHDAF